MPRTARRRHNEIARLIRTIERAGDAAKEQYEIRDRAEERLRELLQVGETHTLDDGRTVECIDNFAATNAIWARAFPRVQRYEIRIRAKKCNRKAKDNEPTAATATA